MDAELIKLVERLDMSTVREKREESLNILNQDARDMSQKLDSVTQNCDFEKGTEMKHMQARMEDMSLELKQLSDNKEELMGKLQKAKQSITELQEERKRQKSKVLQPKARASVNIFRQMSDVKWHEEQEGNEVKGFICSKNGAVKPFCFNKEKQSSFFIANSLWEMGEDDKENEIIQRGGGDGR